jgi:Flp pilus assembly protein CpaB
MINLSTLTVEDKKKLGVIGIAVALGLIATALVSNFMQTTIDRRTSRIIRESEEKRIKPLHAEIQQLKGQLNQVAQAQQGTLQEMQRIASAAAAAAQQGQKTESPPPGLAMRPPAGKRAITVLVDQLSAVGGLIKAGDYVDIIAHLESPERSSEKLTLTLFQNILVLNVGEKSGRSGSSAGQVAVTFAMTPEETGLISFAEQKGALQLVLRSEKEPLQIESVTPSNWQALKEYVRETAGTDIVVPDEASKPAAVEVYKRGTIQR